MTLQDFADQILRPSVLQAIKAGKVDSALCDPDVLDIISDDDEMLKAAMDRIRTILHE